MNISSDTTTDTMTDSEKVDRVCRRRSADTCLFCLPRGAYRRSFWISIFHIGNFCFWVPFLKQLLLRNCVVDFVEISNVYIGKMKIKAADLNFGVTFLKHSVHYSLVTLSLLSFTQHRFLFCQSFYFGIGQKSLRMAYTSTSKITLPELGTPPAWPVVHAC